MEIELSTQDTKDIQVVQELLFNFDVEIGRKRCEAILKERPHLYQIRSYYGFFLQYFDQKESLNQEIKAYEQAPFFFENTSFLLDNILSCFQGKGRALAKLIEQQYSEYQGEKDGYYYICIALLYRLNEEHDKCYELLLQKSADYETQPVVQAWFYHQLGCHFQNKTHFGDDETNENVQNSLKYFQKGIELQPKQKMNYQNIGVQYHRTGQDENYSKALEYFNKCLLIYPHDPYALANMAYLLMDMNKHQAGLEVVQICLQDTKFKFVLQAYQYLILTKFYHLQVDSVNEVFEQMCQGFQSILPAEAYNNELFNCFQNIQIMAIQHNLQYKYTNLIESLISQMREQDPLSLKGLEKYLFNNLLQNEDSDDEDQNALLKFPIQKISDVILKREVSNSAQLLSLVVYNRDIPMVLSFQSNISHWDLFIDG